VSGFVTEVEFELPKGYVDPTGSVHRTGVMRLATAADEIYPLKDLRVRTWPAYLVVLLLERVVTKLGSVPEVHAGVIEGLFSEDLAFLQDLYRRINQDGHTEVAVACPNCGEEFAVDIAGDAPGGS